MSQNYSDLILGLRNNPQFNIDAISTQPVQNAYIGNVPTPEQIQAMYLPQVPQVPQQVQPNTPGQLKPEVEAMLAQQQAAAQQAEMQRQQQFNRDMQTWTPFNFEGHPVLTDISNLPANVVHDLREIGTGFVNIAKHPIDNTVGAYLNYITNTGVYNPDGTVKTIPQRGGEAYDFLLGDITGLKSKSISEIGKAVLTGDFDKAASEAKKAGGEIYRQFMDNPLIFATVVAPGAVGKVAKAGGSQVLKAAERAGIPIGEAAKTVAYTVDAAKTKVASTINKTMEGAEQLRKASVQDLAKVNKNIRLGNKEVPLNENELKIKEAYYKFQKEYNKLLDDNALVSDREMAAVQYVADKEGITYQAAKRKVQPQLDALSDGIEEASLRFENRLNNLEHDINLFKKDLSKDTKRNILNDKDKRKLTELPEEQVNILKKNLSDAEINNLLQADATVAETIQYVRDITRDTLGSTKFKKAAQTNVKYKENMGRLAALAAETGDQTLMHFYEGMKLADKGEIFPVTFAGADIPAGSTIDQAGRRMAGKSSSREYGTATPEAVAKVYKEGINNYIDDVVRGKVTNELERNILNGTIDGENALVRQGAKDIRYINPETLMEKGLSDALKGATKEPITNGIPIEKAYVDAINATLTRPERVLKGIFGDVFKAGKQSMLASLNYLGGNALAGAYGTLMAADSMTGLVSDAVKAIGAKGRLAKELGLYRRATQSTTQGFETGLGKFAGKVNRYSGAKVGELLDKSLQNYFAEINANRALRQAGVKSVAELNALPAQKVGQIIEDVRLSSMMPNTYSFIPPQLQGAVGPFIPFVKWYDTAMQVTADMYKRNPYFTGLIAGDFFGNIGMDKELQERLGLKVYSDKHLVSYVPNDKTGGAKEVTVNFLPQMTPLQLLQPPKEIIRSGIPVVSPLVQALQGRTVYGSPMQRTQEFGKAMTQIQNGRRYKPDLETGVYKPVDGGLPDEIISTALRNTWGAPNLVNRTIGPLTAGLASKISGQDIRFYQPYPQSVFGSYRVGQPDVASSMISTGNPNAQRTLGDVLKGLGTYYEHDYYPQEDIITGRTMKQIRKGSARQNRNRYRAFMEDRD